MITAEQKAIRNNGIFSSDIPRIMAGDGITVALEKMGKIEREDIGDRVEIKIGNISEPLIMDAYERETGELILERSPDTIFHPEHNWLGAHLDGMSTDLNIEVKTVGWYMRSDWGEGGDEVPDRVLWQVQHQMLVANLAITHVPVCFIDEDSIRDMFVGNLPKISIFTVKRDDDLTDYLIQAAREVWDAVQTGVLPEPKKVSDIPLVYPRDTGEVVTADDALFEQYQNLMVARESEKTAETAEEQCKDALKFAMKGASAIEYRHQVLATWKASKDGEQFNEKAFAAAHPELYQQFLIPKPGSRRFLPKTLK